MITERNSEKKLLQVLGAVAGVIGAGLTGVESIPGVTIPIPVYAIWGIITSVLGLFGVTYTRSRPAKHEAMTRAVGHNIMAAREQVERLKMLSEISDASGVARVREKAAKLLNAEK